MVARPGGRWLVAVVLATLAGEAGADLYMQVGVFSNLLVADGKVYFIQADWTLTALDLESGRVLLRRKDRGYSGTLRHTDHGILVLSGYAATLLDETTHAVVWEAHGCYDASVSDGHLVSTGDSGALQCRGVEDGSIRWSYDLSCPVDAVVEEGKVLVYHAASTGGTPWIALLDVRTGKELLRRPPPAGLHCEKAYFDGQRIYLAAGRFAGARADARFEKMLVWDLSGKQVSSIDVPPELCKRLLELYEPFVLDGKTFYDGRVALGVYEGAAFTRLRRLGLYGDTTPDAVRVTVDEVKAASGRAVLVSVKSDTVPSGSTYSRPCIPCSATRAARPLGLPITPGTSAF
jgi:hypothetical protein